MSSKIKTCCFQQYLWGGGLAAGAGCRWLRLLILVNECLGEVISWHPSQGKFIRAPRHAPSPLSSHIVLRVLPLDTWVQCNCVARWRISVMPQELNNSRAGFNDLITVNVCWDAFYHPLLSSLHVPASVSVFTGINVCFPVWECSTCSDLCSTYLS